jgi:hypothetical protein
MATNTLTFPAETRHAHHWVIEEPNGNTSTGRCKRCGETKAFKNWLSESDFVTNEEYRQLAA